MFMCRIFLYIHKQCSIKYVEMLSLSENIEVVNYSVGMYMKKL